MALVVRAGPGVRAQAASVGRPVWRPFGCRRATLPWWAPTLGHRGDARRDRPLERSSDGSLQVAGSPRPTRPSGRHPCDLCRRGTRGLTRCRPAPPSPCRPAHALDGYSGSPLICLPTPRAPIRVAGSGAQGDQPDGRSADSTFESGVGLGHGPAAGPASSSS